MPLRKGHTGRPDWRPWVDEEEWPEAWDQADVVELADVLYSHPHDTACATEMGSLWSLQAGLGAQAVVHQAGIDVSFEIVPGSWNGNPIFRTPQSAALFCTEDAARVLTTPFGRWLSLKPTA